MLIGKYPPQAIPTPSVERTQYRPVARAQYRQHRGAIGVLSVVVLLLLLVAPGYALTRLAMWVDWRLLTAAPVAVSLLTYFAYRHDKRQAELNDWRISERTLHLLELLGGWPGAFLAQRYFRHKTAKASYQFAFWTIVFFHQLLALDSLTAWRFTRMLLAHIRS